jgi:hypothetical protein
MPATSPLVLAIDHAAGRAQRTSESRNNIAQHAV